MQITIDRAGRIVVPKAIREELGFAPGVPLELTADGVSLRIEPALLGGTIENRDGRLIVSCPPGRVVTDDELRQAIDASRR